MKGVSQWSFRPYKPLMFDVGEIYICQIHPDKKKIRFAWLPLDGEKSYTVHLKKRGSHEEYSEYAVTGTSFSIDGLEDETDYEFFVSSEAKKSRVRLARTGFVPGDSVVNYLHPDDEAYSYSGRYLCSPSLVRHPDGYLLASMDVYAGREPQDLTLIFRSDDDGVSWKYVSELFPCFWGKMFIHKGSLYMLSVNTEYGDLLIGRSDDGGVTFASPTVLLRGSSGFAHKGVHKNPQPIIEYCGRMWTTLEWGSWATGTHAAMCASFPIAADPLDPCAWDFTPPVPYDSSWEGTAVGQSSGCIEGCPVIFPDGGLYNVMRYEIGRCDPPFGLAIAMKVNGPDNPLSFAKVIKFPGNHSKFMIKRDPMTRKYLSIVSYLCDEHPTGRNWLALISSDDCENWEKVHDIFDYRNDSADKVGLQYVDFFIEGDDILFLTRTAFGKANNYHDANYSIFTKLCDFRQYLK